MAVRAARAGAEADVIAASFTALVSDLLTASTVGRSTNPSSGEPVDDVARRKSGENGQWTMMHVKG